MMYKIIIAIVGLLYLSGVHAARILAVYHVPAVSHQAAFRPLTSGLLRRGHQVVVVTPIPAYPSGGAPANLTEIDVSASVQEHKIKITSQNTLKNNINLLRVERVIKDLSLLIDSLLQNSQVQKLFKLHKNYFDLILLESGSRISYGIQHVFDAPIIQVSSLSVIPSLYEMMGVPIQPILYPSMICQRLYNLTTWEKIFTIFQQMAVKYYYFPYTHDFDFKILQRNFGEDVPTFDELYKKIKMIFVNEHPLWGENRPLPPNIIYMGGHDRPEQDLPKELKSHLDSSKNGVIYISFGTSIWTSIIPTDKTTMMMKVFSGLPYDVLMKWDGDVIAGQPRNVRIQKWFPQADLLRHPKIKLFITQAGLQSTDEAIDAAVPLIGIPTHGDQWYNSEKYVRHGIGRKLEMLSLTEIEFKNAIESVINDTSYKDNILRLRGLMRAHPIEPLDNAIWWAEHVIATDGDHLKSAAAHVPLSEYYEIKLMLACLCAVLLMFMLFTYLAYTMYKLLKRLFITKFKLKKE